MTGPGGTPHQRPTFGEWAKAVCIWAFLAFWLAGMTAGITAGACLKERIAPGKRLVHCNVTISAGALSRALGDPKPRYATIFLERGLLRAELGRTDLALDDFGAAFDMALASARPFAGYRPDGLDASLFSALAGRAMRDDVSPEVAALFRARLRDRVCRQPAARDLSVCAER